MSEEKKRRFWVVENLKATGIHIQHPSGGKDISLTKYGAVVVKNEEWKDSEFLDQMIDEGYVKTYWAARRPAQIPVLPPEAPQDPASRNVIFEMALGDGVFPDGESKSVALINMVPMEDTSFQGPGQRRVFRSTYLKEVHYDRLFWAKWVLENFARNPHEDRIGIIANRLAEIEKMP